MSVLMEFAMFPTDKSESASEYVSRIIRLIRDSGYQYQLTAMGTIIEFDTMEQALALLQKAYEQLEYDCQRIYSSVKFDIRKGRTDAMKGKIASIESKIGKVNN